MAEQGSGRVVRGTVTFSLDAAYELALPSCAAPPSGHPVVLALHGFGEDCHRMLERFAPLVALGVAVLAAEGPYPVEMRRRVSGEPARIGHAWYQFTGDQPAFVAACAKTAGHLARVLDAAAAEHRLDRSRVVLAGYSQGGYLAGLWALTEPARFRALIAIACRIKTEVFAPDVLAQASRLPVLAIHGSRDERVRPEPQQAAIDVLRRAGFDARIQIHDGGHDLDGTVVAAVQAFLRDDLRFPA